MLGMMRFGLAGDQGSNRLGTVSMVLLCILDVETEQAMICLAPTSMKRW